jgi:predicted RNase H-like HicB family nuclease
MASQSSNTIVLNAIFEKNGAGGYIGYVQEINGVVTEGATLDEATENLIDAAKEMISVKKKMGEHILDKPSLIMKPIELDMEYDC